MKKCDIVIPVWNLKEVTERCIESIIAHTKYPYRLVIVDNGSDATTREYLAGLKNDSHIDEVLLIRNEENLGAAPAFNQGMKAATSPYVLLLNNDTIVTEEWLSEMIKALNSQDDIGIVNPDSNNLGTEIPKGMAIDEFYEKVTKKHKGEFIEISDAVGFCYLMSRKLLDTIGIWSEEYGFGNYEETEHCIEAKRAGFKILMAKGAYVWHEIHATFKTLNLDKADFDKIFEEDKVKFEAKYGRTKRVLFIVSTNDEHTLAGLSEAMYNAAHSGMWVHAIAHPDTKKYPFKKHGWITYFYYGTLLFKWRILLRMCIKKKKYDEIYVVEKKYVDFYQRWKHFHKADVTLID